MTTIYRKLTRLKTYSSAINGTSLKPKESIPDQPKPEIDFFKNFRDVSFILTIYLYFTGWVYIYHYFNSFGLSIRQIDIEFYYFLVYSINVFVYIFSHWQPIIYLLTGALALYFIYYFIRNKAFLTYIPGLFLFAFLYYTSYNAGINSGYRDRFFEDPTLKTVKFIFNELDKESPLSIALQENNENECLRLLTANKDEYFVLVADPLANAETIKKRVLQVYEIKKDNVTLMKLIK